MRPQKRGYSLANQRVALQLYSFIRLLQLQEQALELGHRFRGGMRLHEFAGNLDMF
ncbi:MAG: hypothetical protein ACJ71Q_12875 [Terriglobales bacterium]